MDLLLGKQIKSNHDIQARQLAIPEEINSKLPEQNQGATPWEMNNLQDAICLCISEGFSCYRLFAWLAC